MSVGERIRQLRWKKGVKLGELGAKVGLTAAAMSRYELGQRRISVELAARIAEVLGVPIQALLPTERGGGSGQRGERTISILTALLPEKHRRRDRWMNTPRRCGRPSGASRRCIKHKKTSPVQMQGEGGYFLSEGDSLYFGISVNSSMRLAASS